MAVVNANTRVGKGTIIDVGAIVDHNAGIGDYCHVNAGVTVKANFQKESYRKLEIRFPTGWHPREKWLKTGISMR